MIITKKITNSNVISFIISTIFDIGDIDMPFIQYWCIKNFKVSHKSRSFNSLQYLHSIEVDITVQCVDLRQWRFSCLPESESPLSKLFISILPLTDTTLKLLKQKHLKFALTTEEVLLPDQPESINQIKLENINVDGVRNAALKTKGGSGPLGMDADDWKRIPTATGLEPTTT